MAEITYEDSFRALLNERDSRWNEGAPHGTPVFVSYSFLTEPWREDPNFSTFTERQQEITREVLSDVSEAVGLTFLEVSSGGDIQYGNTVFGDWRSGEALPPIPYRGLGSEVRIEPTREDAYRHVLVHETGHALGLKHPHEGMVQLPDERDNYDQTQMSYSSGPNWGWEIGYPTGMQPYDIQALQYYYGPAGTPGTAWAYDAESETLSLTGTTGADTMMVPRVNGHYASGAGNDTVRGQDWDDTINPGAGRDQVEFGGGADRLIGQADGDTFEFQSYGDDPADVLDYRFVAASVTVSRDDDGMTITNDRTGAVDRNDAYSFEGDLLLTSFDDTIELSWNLRDVVVDGGGGRDTVIIDASENTTPVRVGRDGTLTVTRYDDTWTLKNIERVEWTWDSMGLGRATRDLGPADGSVIDMAADGIIGVSTVYGSAGNDRITGTEAAETFVMGGGRDTVSGGDGWDAVVVEGDRDDSTVSGSAVSASVRGESTLTLRGVETVVFDDGALVLDDGAAVLQAYRLYSAAFDRTPDAAGLGYHAGTLEAGTSLFDAAAGFTGSAEFAGLYGAEPAAGTYVTALYRNVLDRTPDPDGFAYHTGRLAEGTSRAEVLVAFSESVENQAKVAALVADGIWLA